MVDSSELIDIIPYLMNRKDVFRYGVIIGVGVVADYVLRPHAEAESLTTTASVPTTELLSRSPQSVAVNSTEKNISIEQRLAFSKSVLPDYFPDPIKYWALELKKWSVRHDIPVIWLAAIMVNESCGNPRAYNKSGDYGLFQINVMHLGSTPQELRYDSDTNAAMAVSILKNAMVRRNNDPYLSALQYTAGQGAVDRGTTLDVQKAYGRRARDIITGKMTDETKSWLLAVQKSSFCQSAWSIVSKL